MHTLTPTQKRVLAALPPPEAPPLRIWNLAYALRLDTPSEVASALSSLRRRGLATNHKKHVRRWNATAAGVQERERATRILDTTRVMIDMEDTGTHLAFNAQGHGKQGPDKAKNTEAARHALRHLLQALGLPPAKAVVEYHNYGASFHAAKKDLKYL